MSAMSSRRMWATLLGCGVCFMATVAMPVAASAAVEAPSPQPSASASPSTPPAPIVQDSWIVWIDVQGAVTAVEQDVVLTNSATSAYAGGADLGGGKRSVFVLPLTGDAENLQFLGFLTDSTGMRRDTTFVSTAPISPGQSQAALRFETQVLADLVFPITYPTTRFTMMVPDGVEIDAPRLSPDGRSEDRGTSYQVYTGSDLRAGDSIRVAMRRTAVGQEPASSNTMTLTVGACAAIAVAIVVVVRRRRRPTEQAASPAVPRPTRRDQDDTADVELLLDHVALLDLAHERGLVSDDADFRRRRAELTSRIAASWRPVGGVSSSTVPKGEL